MKSRSILSLFRSFSIAIGIILIWRGTWYILDNVDVLLFGGSHIATSILGIIIGVLILYIPDRDLDELGKL